MRQIHCSIILLALVFSGCTNQVLTTLSAIKASNGITQPDGGNGDKLTLLKAVPNSYNASSQIDLVGNGTGEIGKACTVGSTTGSAASNTCRCRYEYTRTVGSSTSTEKIDADAIYVEDDLLRCSKDIVPADVTTLTVKVHVTNSDSYSNGVTLNLSTTSLSIDTTDYRNFNNITRWQCRDLPFSPMPWIGSGIYDPIISEDPAIAIPLNFYFESKGRALTAFVSNPDAAPKTPPGGSAVVGWYCPEGNKNYTHSANDLWLFSMGATTSIPASRTPNNTNYNLGYDQLGTTQVYNRMDLDDRQGFRLARSPAGVWSVPVNAYVAPNTISQLTEIDGQKVAPLGYGASPSSSGNNEESCPSVSIPSGYHWVKVWLFRGSIEPRKYPTSPALKKTSLAMNMPTWDAVNGNYSGTPVFASCGTTSDMLSSGVSTALPAANPMAYRLISVQGSADTGCMNWSAPSATPIYDPKSYFSATTSDTWGYRYNVGMDFNAIYTQSTVLPGNFFQCAAGTNCLSNPAQGNVPGTISMPVEWENIETNSRFDFVMVTTPTNIHAKNLLFPYSTDYAPEYVPYRFKTDPSLATTGVAALCVAAGYTWSDFTGCSGSVAEIEGQKIYYELKLHDVGVNGDSAPGRQPVFPVCAIQKDSQ